jgi:hypothetical protein
MFHPPLLLSVADSMISKMFASPLDFQITFDGCRPEEKQKLFEAVRKNFIVNVSEEVLSKHYMLIFETSNGYSNKPLTSESFQDILASLDNDILDHKIDEAAEELIYCSDSPGKVLPSVKYFHSVALRPTKPRDETIKKDAKGASRKVVQNNRAGQFWPYLHKSKIDLQKFQFSIPSSTKKVCNEKNLRTAVSSTLFSKLVLSQKTCSKRCDFESTAACSINRKYDELLKSLAYISSYIASTMIL